MNKAVLGTIVGTALLGIAKNNFGNKNETLIDMSEILSQGRVLGNGNFSIAVELDSDPDHVYLVSTDPAKDFMVAMHKKYPDNPHIPTIEKIGYTRYQPEFLLGNFEERRDRNNPHIPKLSKSDVNFAITNSTLAQSPIFIYKTPRINLEDMKSCLSKEVYDQKIIPDDLIMMSPRFSKDCRSYTDKEVETLKNLVKEVIKHNESGVFLGFDTSPGNILYDTSKDIVVFNDIFFVAPHQKEIDFFKARRALIPFLDPAIQWNSLFYDESRIRR